MLRIFSISVLLGFLSISAFAVEESLEDINFPLNSSIVVDGFQGLDMLATVMASHSELELEVTGYTDSLGTAEYNTRLSKKRAESVKAYLVSKGVRESNITTSGEGIANNYNNGTREGRFQNRRVSLQMFEVTNGSRVLVPYRRLLELFFGDNVPKPFVEMGKAAMANQDQILQKLTDLEKAQKAMQDEIARHMEEMNARALAPHAPASSAHMSANRSFGGYSGVSAAIGADDDGDFTGQIRGMYFRPVGEDFALQAQGDWSYWDSQEEGQLDTAFIYQNGAWKVAAAGSYKWVSQEGLDTARIGQGAFIADYLFAGAKIGVFGTFPFADGDVLSSNPVGGSFVEELYVNVPVQYGLDVDADITSRFGVSGYVAGLDGETDADVAAGLELKASLNRNLMLYLDIDTNESRLAQGVSDTRYMAGLRFGSWARVPAGRTDNLTPINIPRVRFEILSRIVRNGNTTPVANAGATLNGVAAGVVVLDGSGSFDPDGDALSYQWSQVDGPVVQLRNANTARAQFDGVAGEQYRFRLRVSDSFGETASDEVSVTMVDAPIPVPNVVNFTAAPSVIKKGELANLVWTTANANEVSITGFGVVPSSGQVVVSPEVTTTYTLTATNGSGSVTSSVTITVEEVVIPAPTINFFTASPDVVAPGQFTSLAWSTINAESVAIEGIGNVQASGSVILNPETTTTYVLVALNASGEVRSEVTVTVTVPAPVVEFFTAGPSSINRGEFATLSWATKNSDEVSISGLGRVLATGSILVSPEDTTIYTLTAKNASGTVTAETTVTVTTPGTPPVANAGADQTLSFPDLVTLDGSASFDPDGDTLSYSWVQLGGTPVQLNGANTANPTFTAGGGNYTFRLTVQDPRGLTDTDEVTITVISFKANGQK